MKERIFLIGNFHSKSLFLEEGFGSRLGKNSITNPS
jgi:hypothetical protein